MADLKNMLQADEAAAVDLDKDVVLWVTTDASGTPKLERVTADALHKIQTSWRGFLEQGSDPAAPAEGVLLYAKAGKLFIIDSAGTITEVGADAGANAGMTQGRLSFSTTDPVPTAEFKGSTRCFLLPFLGNNIALYDADSATYSTYAIPDEGTSIYSKSTTQTGNLLNGSNQISNFDGDWQHAVIGYLVSGTNIPAGTTITTIDWETNTLTMSANATGDVTGAVLTLQAPADSKWDVFAHAVDGVVQLHLLKWASSSARATALETSNGVSHLASAEVYKYLGTITMTGTDGEMEDSCGFRGLDNHMKVPGGLWRLDKGAAFAGGTLGYITTTEKQAATWSTGGANAYDGNTATYWSSANLNTTPTLAKIDFGVDVVFNKMRFYWDSSNPDRRPVNLYIEASTTGDFTGEQSVLVNGVASDDAGVKEHSFTRTKARYWRVRGYKNIAAACYVYEIDFYRSFSMAIAGIPYGCKAGLYTSGSLIQEIRNIGWDIWNIQTFTDPDVDTADTLKLTRPDGSTEWLSFGLSPTLGDVYSLYQD